MAGHGTLDPGVEVRVLLPQPYNKVNEAAPSSSGLGCRVLSPTTRVQIPQGLP